MSKNIISFNRLALAVLLIVSGIGSITPIAHAEAPNGNSYLALSPIESLHSHISSVFKKADAAEEIIVDGLTATVRAEKIAAFFKNRENAPMGAYARAFVDAADEYGLDWKLLPAISMIESSGGANACKFANGELKHNAFGWGGCTIAFTSYEAAIDHITKNLAGHDPKTAPYYSGKTVSQIIDKYNPPSVRHDYNEIVTWGMNKIAATEISASAHEIAMK